MRMIFPLIAVLGASGCMSALATPASAQAGQRDPAALLERSDLNGDGRITREEYAQARARMFDRLDRNRDGVLSPNEWPRR